MTPAARNVPAARRVLSAAVLCALLALLPLAAAPYGSVEPWWTGLVGAAVFALAAVWAVEGALAGRWLTRAHALALPWLALAAFALLQSAPLASVGVSSFDPYESRLFALRLLAVTLYASLLLRYVSNERRLRALAVVVVCVGVASALFGIFRQATQREELGFLLPLLRKGEGYAQFVSRNHFAYLAEMALGLVAGTAAGGGAGRGKLLLCAAAALPLFAALLLVAVVVGTVWVGGDPLAGRMETVGDEANAAQGDHARAGRAGIWEDTWRLVEHHPLAGVGLGGYWIAIRATHAGSGLMAPRQAHNDYLELLASSGAVGALLLVVFLFLFARRARERLRAGSPFTRAVCLGALAGLFGVAVHSFVDFGLHVTANAFVCAALVALAAAPVEAEGRDGVQKTSRPEY